MKKYFLTISFLAIGLFLKAQSNLSTYLQREADYQRLSGVVLVCQNGERVYNEAFGYFGAARDYAAYSDEALAGKNGLSFYKDGNGDSKIDFHSEYNFGFSRNAGKRDLGGAQNTNFTKDAFDAFLAGTYIT